MPVFEYTHSLRPVSSWISVVYYNENTSELTINAHGNSYVYVDVPMGVFDDFQDNYSAGDTYNSRVRGQYSTKYATARKDMSFSMVYVKEAVTMAEKKTFTVRAIVPFEAQIEAETLEEAVKAFLESNKAVPGIEIKEVAFVK